MATANRKLTTIFSADVQGYSRLMEADEEGTFATLKSYRDAMARLIEAHGGRVVNTWGDGLIAEFGSVVGAVRAAVDIQNELARKNENRPDGRQMLFRVGINLGDVIVDGDDIYGDGVNIAARLQAEAEPGGILISSTVYDQVRNKMTVGFEFLGNLSVKNIDDAVPSYAVRIGSEAQARRSAAPPPAAETPPARPVRGPEPAIADTLVVAGYQIDRRLAVLAGLGVLMVVVNLATSPDSFWARWPILGFAAAAAIGWLRRSQRVDPVLGGLGIAAAVVVSVNLFSWEGQFWARWPLLGITTVAAARWLLWKRA
ncbi:adenylate/guanylate cyclase domain-containing protein [Pseudaminobacter sp. 19-2017]|uniref:Adenylate/guanylate cyclase domain-containing protein n=1 Tax=Pseudaminobacter soli (ex Zhang et al. 2022) TaxID=2831468 RepID=A0A942DVP4_9HYPH|nr:adenylate/guanylate cyclase domain-containing protein [Pseudaminobacter soli]MBS3648279.1 adenylate/guanylate cyclase domain-containing protein [Pseudaminobacter soli]